MKSLLAAVLSMCLPGLGQLYKGYFMQAVAWFLLLAVLYSLLYWFIFALVPIVFHLLCIFQAYFMPPARD